MLKLYILYLVAKPQQMLSANPEQAFVDSIITTRKEREMKSKVFYFECESDEEPNVGEQADKALTEWLTELPKSVRIVHCVQSLTSPLRADKLVLTILYLED